MHVQHSHEIYLRIIIEWFQESGMGTVSGPYEFHRLHGSCTQSDECRLMVEIAIGLVCQENVLFGRQHTSLSLHICYS